MKNKVIDLNQLNRKETKKEQESVNTLGCIYLELLMSDDGKQIFFQPGYDLNTCVDENLFKQYCDLIKDKLPLTLEHLVKLYQSK